MWIREDTRSQGASVEINVGCQSVSVIFFSEQTYLRMMEIYFQILCKSLRLAFIYVLFPFNSVISMHIDIKHLCHHVYYGSGPTNTALTNNQAFWDICHVSYVIIIEPSNQICVTITKCHALSAWQSTMTLFSATEWFSKWFIIGTIKKKVSFHLVWKIKWAIWWQISRHWLDFWELYQKR